MGWATWMQIKPSTEELFEIERSVRSVQNCTDEEQLKMICALLVRQNFYQSKLLHKTSGVETLDGPFHRRVSYTMLFRDV